MPAYVESLQAAIDAANQEMQQHVLEMRDAYKVIHPVDFATMILGFKLKHEGKFQIDFHTPISFRKAERIFKDKKYSRELQGLMKNEGAEITGIIDYVIYEYSNGDQIVRHCPELAARIASQGKLLQLLEIAWDIVDICLKLNEDPHQKWLEYKQGKRGEKLFSREVLRTVIPNEESIDNFYKNLSRDHNQDLP